MRVTYERAIKKLIAGSPGRIGKLDTVVCTMAGGGGYYGAWYYHESPIVTVDESGVYVNWYGWYTYSTTQRIRAVCAYLGVAIPSKGEGDIKICEKLVI